VRKAIFPSLVAAVVLAAVQAQAATVTFAIATDGATNGWALWATDSVGDNFGLAGLAATVTGVTGSVALRAPNASIDNQAQDGSSDVIGWATANGGGASSGGVTNITLGQPASMVYSANEYVMGMGQSVGDLTSYITSQVDPGSGNNYEVNLVSNRMAGDSSKIGTYGVAAHGTNGTGTSLVTNPFGTVGIELASGTDAVAGTLPTLSNLGANVFFSVPTAATSSGTTGAATIGSPEPASLALLAFGGMMVLARRRRA